MTDFTEIKKIVNEWLYANKLDNLAKIDKFLKDTN